MRTNEYRIIDYSLPSERFGDILEVYSIQERHYHSYRFLFWTFNWDSWEEVNQCYSKVQCQNLIESLRKVRQRYGSNLLQVTINEASDFLDADWERRLLSGE
jgi:hypothetical protein